MTVRPASNDQAFSIRRWFSPHLIGPLVALAVTVIAFWMLYRMTAEMKLSDVRSAFTGLPRPAVFLSLAATAVSYLALASYDIMATRIAAPGRIDWRVASISGMAGFAFSNFLGFHLLTGGAVRYRIYARLGLDGADIATIVILTWTGLWLAITGLIAAALIIDPAGIPFVHVIQPFFDQALGLAMLAAVAGLFAFAGQDGRRFALFGWQISLPGRGPLTFQLVAGLIDLSGATYALYVLMPPDLQPGFFAFLVVYLSATLIGVVSHVPGGIGVFEVTMMAALGAYGRADILAALLAYRTIYYVAPFVIAAILLAITEAGWMRGRLKGATGGAANRLLRPLVPPVAAVIVFLAGLVLMVSGSIPHAPVRLAEIRGWLPLAVLESSHFLASLSGLSLLILASGLRRRLQSAWVAAMAVLTAGAAFSLLKGGDWQEALIMAGGALLLLVFRSAFYRRRRERLAIVSGRWLALLAITVALTVLLGFLSYRHIDPTGPLWWQFAWKGEAPRFLRASGGLVVATLCVGFASWFFRSATRTVPVSAPVPAVVSRLLGVSGDARANVAFIGDKTFLIAPDESAFLMYRRSGRSLVSMGDPVGDPRAHAELVWDFRENADRHAMRAVFYAVRPDTLPLYVDMGYTILKIGEIARVPLSTFSLDGHANQDHRYAVRRLERESITFDVVPAADFAAVEAELAQVSNQWLAGKNGREKGFSLGSFDPVYLGRFDTAVLRQHGRIIAFANIWRAGDGSELSADLMRSVPGISKGLMDGLFVHLMLHGKRENYAFFNFGAAPLSGLPDHPLASTWARIGTAMFRHGENFYHFEGLRAFKQKFDPVWTPQYLACPRGLAVPQVLLDINRLISGPASDLLARRRTTPNVQRDAEPIR